MNTWAKDYFISEVVILSAILELWFGGRSDGGGRVGGHLMLEYQKSASAHTASTVSRDAGHFQSQPAANSPRGRRLVRLTIFGTPS